MNEDSERSHRRWEARELRQKQALTPESHLHMAFILDEALLRKPPNGKTDIQRQQIQHVLDTMSRENVSVRVIPDRVGPYPGYGFPYLLLNFRSEDCLRPILYMEHLDSGTVSHEDSDKTREYYKLFEKMETLALTEPQSHHLMTEVIHHLQ
jgi:hypothetical protein